MSDDSHILTFHFRVHKYGANIYKFEAVATANDTGFTEKSVDSDIGKGAAGQAIQNMNLIMGIPETTGLMMPPMYP